MDSVQFERYEEAKNKKAYSKGQYTYEKIIKVTTI